MEVCMVQQFSAVIVSLISCTGKLICMPHVSCMTRALTHLLFLSLSRLWTPIDGEFDDYIVNPKPSGYQVKLVQLP